MNRKLSEELDMELLMNIAKKSGSTIFKNNDFNNITGCKCLSTISKITYDIPVYLSIFLYVTFEDLLSLQQYKVKSIEFKSKDGAK